MHIRTAEKNDFARIKRLYQRVARQGGGIARTEDEVTDEYVHGFLNKALSQGIILVAVDEKNDDELIGEVHTYKHGIQVFDHVLGNLTIAVDPDHQGKKVGRTLFTILLEEIGLNRPDIGRVELMVRESNVRAIEFYQSLGFQIEGRFEMRVISPNNEYEADIPMAWQNPNFEFDR